MTNKTAELAAEAADQLPTHSRSDQGMRIERKHYAEIIAATYDAAIDSLTARLSAAEQRVEELEAMFSKIRESAIDGQNELHGIRHGGPAKRTLKYIESLSGKAVSDDEQNG